jgi:hypothetical protein
MVTNKQAGMDSIGRGECRKEGYACKEKSKGGAHIGEGQEGACWPGAPIRDLRK